MKLGIDDHDQYRGTSVLGERSSSWYLTKLGESQKQTQRNAYGQPERKISLATQRNKNFDNVLEHCKGEANKETKTASKFCDEEVPGVDEVLKDP